MKAALQKKIDVFMAKVIAKNPSETEFHQAVHEVVSSVLPFAENKKEYQEAQILERLTEPDRSVSFRVVWEDDQGVVQVNRGYRVQFNNAVGPYKGGLRFHPTVNLGILKFLGFEQIFKNSLTGLPIGGGKGGADFDPKGKSDREVMRFCQAFMSELYRYIGPNLDVPAGDIGVGARELGFLFGYYKKIQSEFTGVFTGKGLSYGGSLIRPEATGYGCTYFVREMLKRNNDTLEGKVCLVSGAGNVAQFMVEKLLSFGATVITMSDSEGTLVDTAGFTQEKLAQVKHLKNEERGRLACLGGQGSFQFLKQQTPWHIPCDAAFPCATQNEIGEQDARTLVQNQCKIVAEGANMPCHETAVTVFQKAGVLFAPAKAANAGGVAVSALEMSQNSQRLSWSRDEVEAKLAQIMRNIHEQCVQYGSSPNSKTVDYVQGANIAGFVKVADAMLAQGVY